MTKKRDDNSPTAHFSSPPCSMSEVDPVYMGLAAPDGLPEELSSKALAGLTDAVLHKLPDAIVYADVEGIIRYWNPGAERVFGFSAGEAVGESLDLIIPERLQRRHWDGYYRMMKTGQSQHEPEELLSVPAVTKSGQTLSVQFTVAPVTGPEDTLTGIVALLRDVTATFEELKKLRASK